MPLAAGLRRRYHECRRAPGAKVAMPVRARQRRDDTSASTPIISHGRKATCLLPEGRSASRMRPAHPALTDPGAFFTPPKSQGAPATVFAAIEAPACGCASRSSPTCACGCGHWHARRHRGGVHRPVRRCVHQRRRRRAALCHCAAGRDPDWCHRMAPAALEAGPRGVIGATGPPPAVPGHRVKAVDATGAGATACRLPLARLAAGDDFGARSVTPMRPQPSPVPMARWRPCPTAGVPALLQAAQST